MSEAFRVEVSRSPRLYPPLEGNVIEHLTRRKRRACPRTLPRDLQLVKWQVSGICPPSSEIYQLTFHLWWPAYNSSWPPRGFMSTSKFLMTPNKENHVKIRLLCSGLMPKARQGRWLCGQTWECPSFKFLEGIGDWRSQVSCLSTTDHRWASPTQHHLFPHTASSFSYLKQLPQRFFLHYHLIKRNIIIHVSTLATSRCFLQNKCHRNSFFSGDFFFLCSSALTPGSCTLPPSTSQMTKQNRLQDTGKHERHAADLLMQYHSQRTLQIGLPQEIWSWVMQQVGHAQTQDSPGGPVSPQPRANCDGIKTPVILLSKFVKN